jgi:hypothetical protein
MTIEEYILDPQDKPRSYNPKTIPSFIIDGGYWRNPDGSEKMIAMIPDNDVPDGATTYTLAELQARQRAIHAEHPMKVDGSNYPESDNMTVDEVNAAVKAWVDDRS